MEVILLEKVENLGNLGDLVSVRPGFGRNYLIPGGKAVLANEQNRATFEARRAELEQAAAAALAAAQARREQLAALRLVVARKAGEEGRLFGSVGTVDIAEAATAAGVYVTRQEVRLPAGPIRQTGEYQVTLHLHPEVNAEITVDIVPEE